MSSSACSRLSSASSLCASSFALALLLSLLRLPCSHCRFGLCFLRATGECASLDVFVRLIFNGCVSRTGGSRLGDSSCTLGILFGAAHCQSQHCKLHSQDNSLFTALVPASLSSAPTGFAGALFNSSLYLLRFLIMFSTPDCASSLARDRVYAPSGDFHALFSCLLIALAAKARSAKLGCDGNVERVPLPVQCFFSRCSLS